MGKMPCSITDDPMNDYSDYFEKKGAYKPAKEDDPDYEYQHQRDMFDDEPTDYESMTHGY